MKQSILGLAMAVCMLIAMTGCGSTVLTVPTPSEGAAQENETFSTQPDSAPNATPQESLPPTETGEAAPPHEPDETARPGTTANPSELAQSGTTAAPHTTPPVSTVTPPSKTPESSQLVTDALIQNGGASQNSTTGQKTQAPVISQITQLESGFSSASFSGNDGFEDFLELGGASTDAQVTAFLSTRLASNAALAGGAFGCSTIAVKSPAGNSLFGRNFDWQACDALVVTSKPEGGYASISTVNMDFIRQGDDGSLGTALQQNDARVMAALYAPLDGMNEKGLAVSVNMIQDSASINQSTDKPDITTTTAIRLLLNKAASVDEALELLRQYDMHASLGMMIHFALADTTGRSVVVEYVGNQMIVTDTPVVTNFYLSEGSKHGVGTQQSHTRYDMLVQALADQQTMDMDGVRNALDSVSKDNFGEFESTEWSAVFNLSTGIAQYYHRENYTTAYEFSIK